MKSGPPKIKVNRHLCSGCLSCMTICSMVNEGYASLSAGRVQITLNPFGGTHKVAVCQQCTRAFCVEACPQEAISRRKDGALVIDYDRCTSCRACIEACPFNAIFWNPISERVIKCELCGGDPACVQVCATGALVFQIVGKKERDKR